MKFSSLAPLLIALAVPHAWGGTETLDPKAAQAPAETKSLWTQDTLLGDAGGLRPALDAEGLTIAPTYTGEIFGNTSGGTGPLKRGRGFIYESLVNLPIDFVPEKVAPEWKDGHFHVNGYWITSTQGQGLSGTYLGDLGNTSNIQGYDTFRLDELWYEHCLLDGALAIKVGNIAADTEFFTTSTGALFLNGAFGTPLGISTNLPDPHAPNVYPLASPGFRLLGHPTEQIYLQSGLFSGSAGTQPANANGVKFPFNARSGLLLFNEAGYLLNQGKDDKGLPGTYKFGSFVSTGNFQSWTTQAAVAAGTPGTHGSGVDYGLYAIADQQVYAKDGRIVSLYARGTHAPASINEVEWSTDGGINLTGFLPTRDQDILGLALARSFISGNYSDLQVIQNPGTANFSGETTLETSYKIALAPWWSLQPDFQYIWNPGGRSGAPNATVLGLRTSVAF